MAMVLLISPPKNIVRKPSIKPIVHSCPKCGGFLIFDYGFVNCVNCGYEQYYIRKNNKGKK